MTSRSWTGFLTQAATILRQLRGTTLTGKTMEDFLPREIHVMDTTIKQLKKEIIVVLFLLPGNIATIQTRHPGQQEITTITG